jgi:hypothetical protein
MHRVLLVLGMLAGGVLIAPRAEAKVVRFHGPHPIAPGLTKGMCYLEGPHVHAYEPHQSLLYRRSAKGHVFVGDPVEFEPAAPKVAYYGHHPAFWLGSRDGEPAYCYITGPHHHWHGPPPGAQFKVKHGAHWYVAPHPRGYRHDHPHVAALHAHYDGVHLVRPVVVAEAPDGFVGVLVTPTGFLHVRGPGVVVHVDGIIPIWDVHLKVHGMGHGMGHHKLKWKGGHWKHKGGMRR